MPLNGRKGRLEAGEDRHRPGARTADELARGGERFVDARADFAEQRVDPLHLP